MYSVKHAATLTGITPDTLRMWERRYGVVTPTRSSGGYREYDDTAITRLTAMRALVEAGWSPRLAAERVASGTTAGPVVDGHDHDGPEPDAAALGDPDALVRLAGEFDARALDAVLDEMLGRDDFEHVVEAWLMPALRRLGSEWHRGSVTVAGEHFVSAAVQRRVATILDATPVDPAGPRVVVGLARGSRHELGVLTFAVALRRAGIDVTYVGGDLPAESWVVTVTAHRPAAVVLGVPSSEDVPAVRDAVAALTAAAPDLEVFLGGRYQDDVGGAAEPLGHALADAATNLAHRLRAAAPA